MYNRYIPNQNGCYEKKIMEQTEPPPQKPAPETMKSGMNTASVKGCSSKAFSFDFSDLLFFCIAMLLIAENEEDDISSLLITLIAFFIVQ